MSAVMMTAAMDSIKSLPIGSLVDLIPIGSLVDLSLPLAPPQVLFQLTYTTVFGWYEAYLFVSTGSLVPPILVHSFCNWMQVPDVTR